MQPFTGQEAVQQVSLLPVSKAAGVQGLQGKATPGHGSVTGETSRIMEIWVSHHEFAHCIAKMSDPVFLCSSWLFSCISLYFQAISRLFVAAPNPAAPAICAINKGPNLKGAAGQCWPNISHFARPFSGQDHPG